MKSLECVSSWQAHASYVSALVTNQNYLFSGGWDCVINMWDIKDISKPKILKSVLKESTSSKHTGGHVSNVSRSQKYIFHFVEFDL